MSSSLLDERNIQRHRKVHTAYPRTPQSPVDPFQMVKVKTASSPTFTRHQMQVTVQICRSMSSFRAVASTKTPALTTEELFLERLIWAW